MIPTMFTPKLFSILREGYGFSNLRADVVAGLTVAIVALPLAMALGIASGASPDKGLITAVVAGFLISLLGGSRVQIGGPTGAFIVVVFSVIHDHGYDGLLMASMLAGLILIIAGYSRLGQVMRYVPYPVVTGFTAAIAVIIATSQVKDFFGLEIGAVSADFVDKWGAYIHNMHSLDLTTFGVGFGALLMIILLKKYVPKAPGYLITVIVGSACVYFMNLSVDTIGSSFPNIQAGLPVPSLPVWDVHKFVEIIPSAFTIAFLAGIEALLSATVADGMTGFKHRSNQELIGQGVANIASSVFGGLPATGAIARTATNVKAGGKTPVAGISHALFILLFVLFFTDVMKFIPLCVLAAILLVVAWNMSEKHHFVHIFRLSREDRLVMILTFGLTILVDLTVAIAVGVTLSSLLFVHQMSRSTGFYSQGRRIRDVAERHSEEEIKRDELPDGVEVFRITGPIFFGMIETMLDALGRMGEKPRVLIIRMKLVPYMDVAGLNAMKNLFAQCGDQGTQVILSQLRGQPEAIMHKANICEIFPHVQLVGSYDEAVMHAETLVK